MSDTPIFERGEYAFTLGQWALKGRLTYESMMRIEKRLGQSLTMVMQKFLVGNIQLTDVRDILYEMVHEVDNSKSITVDTVGKALFAHGYLKPAAPLIQFVGRILAVGHDEVEKEASEKGEAQAGT